MIEIESILKLFDQNVLTGDYIIKSLMLLKDEDIDNFFNYYLGLNGYIYMGSAYPVLEIHTSSNTVEVYSDWSLNDYCLTKKYHRLKRIDDIIG
jgi:hypothetical protein